MMRSGGLGPGAAARGSLALGVCSLVALVGVIAPRVVSAQQDDTARPATLTLEQAVATTLHYNPTILSSTAQTKHDRGALLDARGAFDPQLVTSVGRTRANQVSQSPVDPALLLPVLTNQMSYDLGVQKQLRSGITLKPDISISRSDYSSAPGLATAQSSVQLNVTVPLWKDRFGAITASAERAADYGYRASALTLRHTWAEGALDAATAYWGYVAAVEQLEVFRSSETRAQEMLNDTRRLVAAEERAASDVQQATANLASKRVARIDAEQRLIEARAQLGVMMGIPADAIETLALPATAFPALPDTASHATHAAGDPVGFRADYAAAELSERAAATLDASARNDLRPRLDLTVGLGYVGMANGFGFGRFVAPLYRNVPGLNASLELRYEFPITNTGAEGREVQQAATYDQERIARADLARRIRSNVAVARAALRHGQLALAESHEAVSLAETTVRNEQRKFRLDASTMFDVIQAQDALTNAQLNEITSAQHFAVAIATLRFETGALATGDTTTLDVNQLLTPP